MQDWPRVSDGLEAPGLILVTLALLGGCWPDGSPEGLRRTPGGAGPTILFELRGRPLPAIPFPNDLVTRPDVDSPTGLRLNLPFVAPTQAERELRELTGQLAGFSTFGPLTVSFSAPLDLEALDGRGRPFDEDPVLLLDVTPGPTFAARIPLDLGRGNFPLVVADPAAYFDHDPRAGESNLWFETVNEDRDHDGVLSPGEDTDGDGRLDLSNTFSANGDPVDDLVTFYERATETLIVRPIVPMLPGHTYAVVITEEVRGESGEPARSPFEFIHHTRQTTALERLPRALADHGVEIDQVAFAWSFTTQRATDDLVDLRRGLAQTGPFAELGSTFQPEVFRVDPLKSPSRLLRTTELIEALTALVPWLPFLDGQNRTVVEHFVSTFQDVDYLVAGRFMTPYLLIDDDDQANEPAYPADEDEIFRLDARTGEVEVKGRVVPFWCTVPRPRDDRGFNSGPPFPVVLYAHDFDGTRLQALGAAGTFARWGFATCAINAVGHGMSLTDSMADAIDDLLEPLGLQPFRFVLEGIRARDLNNDGVSDSGGDAFTADAVHTRDVIRQSALDWMQLIRVLRAFDGSRPWHSAGVGETAGDFDGDGVVDFGGPSTTYHLMGVGLGGILAGILGGVEPYLSSVAMVSGAGGLTDVAARSAQAGIPEGFLLRAMGPLIVGDPAQSHISTVRFVVPDGRDRASRPIAQIQPLQPGNRVVVRNLRSDEAAEAVVNHEGAFQVAVAADALTPTQIRVRQEVTPWTGTEGLGDALRLEVYDNADKLKFTVDAFEENVTFNGVVYGAGQPLVAIASGWGLKRQTPELRQFLQITQTLLEPADPIAYARHQFVDPIDYGAAAPGAPKGTNLLVVVTAGDTQMPTASGLAFARAAGVLPFDEILPAHGRSANDLLIRYGVTEGLARLERFGEGLFDVDDLSEGSDGLRGPRLDPALRVTIDRSDGGQVGLRVPLLDPSGQHGLRLPRPDKAWDGETYMLNLIARHFTTGDLEHLPCLSDSSCDFVPSAPAE